MNTIELHRRITLGDYSHHAWKIALTAPAILFPIQLVGGCGSLSVSVLLLLLFVCAVTDTWQKRIPNWATYTALVWAVGLNLVVWFSDTVLVAHRWVDPTSEERLANVLGGVGLGECLVGAAICFAVMLAIYRVAGGGAGDVKLAAAVGALCGVQQGLTILGYTYIVAAFAAVAWSTWKHGLAKLLTGIGRTIGSFFVPLWILPPTEKQRVMLNLTVPLAPFFAVGTLIALFGFTM